VVTRDEAWAAQGVQAARSLDEALELAQGLAAGGEVMVIGGAELFAAALPKANRIYMTEVHRDYAGDAFLASCDPAQWREVSRENHAGDPPFSFVVLERR
jgi:dihydrofolate reductase